MNTEHEYNLKKYEDVKKTVDMLRRMREELNSHYENIVKTQKPSDRLITYMGVHHGQLAQVLHNAIKDLSDKEKNEDMIKNRNK